MSFPLVQYLASGFSLPRRAQLARFWAVPVVALMLCAAVIALSAKLLADEIEEADQHGRAAAQQSVSSAEAHVNRVLVSIDGLLLSQPSWLALATASGGQLDLTRLRQVMRLNAQHSLAARDLLIVQPNGAVLAQVLRAAGGPGWPDGFVQEVLARGPSTLHFSKVITSPNTAERMVYAARLIRGTDGSPLVAMAQISVGLLGVSLGHGGDWVGASVGLVTQDGQWLAQMPEGALAFGFSATAAQPGSGVEGAALRDGRARLMQLGNGADSVASWVAVRPTLYPQLSVVASVPHDNLVGHAAPHRDQIWAVALAGVALLVGLAIIVWRHLTLQAALRDQLHATQQILVNAMDSMTEGFLVLDRSLRVISVNEQFCVMFPWLRERAAPGVELRELMQLTAAQIKPDGDAAEREAWAAYRIEQMRTAGSAAVHQYPDGRSVLSEHRTTPQGHLVIQYREVTQQLADRRELQIARDEAQAANRAKSNFLAVMSHEIRTPMSGVLGMAELLAQSKLQPDQAEALQAIRDSGDFLLRLVDDILDFSKLEANLLELDEQPLQIRDVLGSACMALMPVAAKRVVDLSWSLGPTVPAWLLGDSVRLRQVLTNLVGNAIKFSAGRADVKGVVQVQADWVPLADTAAGQDGRREGTQEGGQLVLRVKDNGIGLTDAAQAKLFAPFVQAEASTTRRYGGTGLGLAICRRIAERMGGKIEVRSQAGKGATFEVWLPLKSVTAPQGGLARSAAIPLVSPAPEGSTAAAGRAPATRVLVVEDHAINQRLIMRQLDLLGVAHDLRADGREALAAWRAAAEAGHPYAMVLTDLQMPVMDGTQLAEAIRHLEQHGQMSALTGGGVPIIGLSANAMVIPAVSPGAQALFNGALTKPAQLDELRQLLSHWAPDSLKPQISRSS